MRYKYAPEKNPIWDWLHDHGWEPPAELVGPLAAGSRHGVHANPIPEPWKIAADLVRAAQAKVAARKLPLAQQKAVTKSADASVARIFEDDCGTPPRKWPWPWPGPPPWVWEVMSDLTLVANTLQPGELKDEIESIAGQLGAKAAGAPA